MGWGCVSLGVVTACDPNGHCVADNGMLCGQQDPCVDVECSATEARCDGDLLNHGSQGECNPATGECEPTPGAPPEDCTANGQICRDAACIDPADPCDSSCTSMDPICDGDVLRAEVNVCNPDTGQCEPEEGGVRDCAAEGLVCQDGDCVPGGDLCADVVCEGSPPACEGNIFLGGSSAECDPRSGECVESPGDHPVDCAGDGLVCFNAACVDPANYDPCQGHVCGDRCRICGPNDDNCVEPAVISACNFRNQCVPEGPDLCEDDMPPPGPQAIGTVDCAEAVLPGDPFSIEAVALEGEQLNVVVQYGGGCEEHTFASCFENFVVDENGSSVEMVLAHQGNGDRCRALVRQNVVIEIGAMLQAYGERFPDGANTLTMHLNLWGAPIEFP